MEKNGVIQKDNRGGFRRHSGRRTMAEIIQDTLDEKKRDENKKAKNVISFIKSNVSRVNILICIDQCELQSMGGILTVRSELKKHIASMIKDKTAND